MSRSLDVYLLDRKAGLLKQEDQGTLTFTYDKAYLDAQAPKISVSMPLREEPYDDRIARPYFSGLLPDERARQRLASALGVSEGNAFGLLEVIGRECAGAVSLYPLGEHPLEETDPHGIEELDEARLVAILEKLRGRPLLGGEEGVRLSLAGAQDKLAVCIEDDRIALAKGGRPTTHILKPFIQALDGTVENELFCMRLAQKMGFAVPTVAMRKAGDIPFFLIERYDRIKSGGLVQRLHQEDFCQALSVPPELKYEAEGGPGIERCQALIGENTRRPAADRLMFQRMIMFHYLVGNADAHAKNYALLYRGETPDLAPLYDVICTAAYPNIEKKLAMSIGGRSVPDTIQLDHWLTLVPPTKAAQRLMIRTLKQAAEEITSAADNLITEFDAEEITHPIVRRVRELIGKRATHISRIVGSAD